MRSFARRLLSCLTWRGLFATSATTGIALLLSALVVAQETPRSLFDDARALEATLRKEMATARSGSASTPLVRRARILISTYEDIARLYPQSGYGDKSLWQGASLAADVFDLFKDGTDRAAAVRLTDLIESRYPSSSVLAQARRRVGTLPPAASPASTVASVPLTDSSTVPVTSPKPTVRPTSTTVPPVNTLRSIRREVLAEVLRVSLELDREVTFHDERLDGPPRVFVDLQNTRAAPDIHEGVAFDDDVVRQIRVGRQLDRRVRVVLDLSNAPAHSIYTLYDPFRVVVDFERHRGGVPSSAEPSRDLATAVHASAAPPLAPAVVPPIPANVTAVADSPVPPVPASPPPVRSTGVASATKPEAIAAANKPPASLPTGFSMSRQLGLGIQRVVIDPGHGGHDPGAKQGEIAESELVLDVSLRLEQILRKEEIEVMLTRRSNVYVALEERPAIALREQADLYLSIHANASADRRVRGVETYILNFAPNALSAALAARENSGSTRTMKNLPDLVKAIALNNKIDESRDLARQVQASLVEKLSKGNRTVRNLGVKQAPFAVLVGTDMPSVLAEIAFITNKQDAALVRTGDYRQQIAEALANGILRYQKRLKPSQVAASQ